MSISKIKAMTETLREMEKMQESVVNDINKDINKKRKAALKEIRTYLDELTDSLDGQQITIDLGKLVFGQFQNGQSIFFNQKYLIKRDGLDCHYNEYSKPVKWYIGTYRSTKKDDNHYYYHIDSTNSISIEGKTIWSEGFINLIEKWPEIKTTIEAGLEKKLTERMEEIRKSTADRVESYEKVNDFKA